MACTFIIGLVLLSVILVIIFIARAGNSKPTQEDKPTVKQWDGYMHDPFDQKMTDDELRY